MPCSKKTTKKEKKIIKKILSKLKKGEVECEVLFGCVNGKTKGDSVVLKKSDYEINKNQLKVL